jgi:hypothetical protein
MIDIPIRQGYHFYEDENGQKLEVCFPACFHRPCRIHAFSVFYLPRRFFPVSGPVFQGVAVKRASLLFLHSVSPLLSQPAPLTSLSFRSLNFQRADRKGGQ